MLRVLSQRIFAYPVALLWHRRINRGHHTGITGWLWDRVNFVSLNQCISFVYINPNFHIKTCIFQASFHAYTMFKSKASHFYSHWSGRVSSVSYVRNFDVGFRLLDLLEKQWHGGEKMPLEQSHPFYGSHQNFLATEREQKQGSHITTRRECL